MIGTTEHVSAKLAKLYDVLRFDRVQALVDWGGLPSVAVQESLHRLGEEGAAALRRHAGERTPGGGQLTDACGGGPVTSTPTVPGTGSVPV